MSALPVYSPQVSVRRTTVARRSRRSVARPLPTAFKMTVAVASAFVFVCVYAISSLVGHALSEQARHSHVDASGRAIAARADSARLRESVDRLTTVGALDRWARTHGFVLEGGRRVTYVATEDQVL